MFSLKDLSKTKVLIALVCLAAIFYIAGIMVGVGLVILVGFIFEVLFWIGLVGKGKASKL